MEILCTFITLTFAFLTTISGAPPQGGNPGDDDHFSVHHLDGKNGETWCYNSPHCNEKTWGGICKSGGEQSPIDLPSIETFEVDNYIEHFPRSSYNITGFTLVNNGHSLEIVPEKTKLPHFYWPKQKETYRLYSVHFHWGKGDKVGSEHAINSNHFALECHLVHHSAEFSTLSEALESKKRNALAVISVLLQVNKPGITVGSRLMHPLIRHFPKMTEASSRLRSGDTLDMQEFFQGTQAYSYKGSLTTPTCNEQVAWLVWATPVNISTVDVSAFRQLRDFKGKPLVNNFRSLKPLNGREVDLVGIHYTIGKVDTLLQNVHKNKE